MTFDDWAMLMIMITLYAAFLGVWWARAGSAARQHQVTDKSLRGHKAPHQVTKTTKIAMAMANGHGHDHFLLV